ncbi:MAG TPA: HAD family hydrolase [Edaphobacter sp.]|nr:HAD family hydrolase [Edaphobacter sp.]
MGQNHLLRLPEALFFDLDGTLLDSLPGIQHSIVAAFRECNLPMADIEVRSLIGPPIRTILSRLMLSATAENEESCLDRLERAFRVSYDSEGWQKTYHYSDAATMLRKIKAQGVILFVISNKPRHVSLNILEAEGTLAYFDEVVTRDSRQPPYLDKEEMLSSLLSVRRIRPEKCLMVGDTMEDASAAAAVGMQFCLMTHGYGDVPIGSKIPVTLRLGNFAELMDVLDRSVPMVGRGVQD